MHVRPMTAILVLLIPGLVLGACGGGSTTPGYGTIAIVSIAPSPLPGASATPITITGGDFSELVGVPVIVRFEAIGGTPFGGGGLAVVEVPGTITSASTIASTSPVACVGGGATITATVTVILPSGVSASSSTAIATFSGPSLTGGTGNFLPATAPSEVPTTFTLDGSGFGDPGTPVQVRFTATAGTPFQGGASATVDVGGTVTATGITGLTPVTTICGIANPTASVTVVHTAAGCASAPQVSTTGAVITFMPPTFTAIQGPATIRDPTSYLVGNGQFTITGTDFAPVGQICNVTFTATGSTPFASGTSATAQAAAVIVNATTIQGTAPELLGVYGAPVGTQIVFPSGTCVTFAGTDPLLVSDPLFPDQWHLRNTGVNSASTISGNGTLGEDANLVPAWDLGLTGTGTVIAVVDTGYQTSHEDLAAAYVPGTGFDFLDLDTNPSPTASPDNHGTSVAGVCAARGGNGIGVTGAAPRAGLTGFNILATGAPQTSPAFNDPACFNDSTCIALSRNSNSIDIRNNSWGYTSNAFFAMPLPHLVAMDNGIVMGRLYQPPGPFPPPPAPLGTVFVFTSGNNDDNGRYATTSEHKSHRGVILVGAVDHNGQRTCYSERGPNVWVCAPSADAVCNPTFSNQGIGTTTTDREGGFGYNANGTSGWGAQYADTNYHAWFNGTSSAAPVVSGVCALMLEANPALTWRDVKEILGRTARQNDPAHPDWQTNGAGLAINHDYGFGVVDAGAALAAAQTWTPQTTPVQLQQTRMGGPWGIPDNGTITVFNFLASAGGNINTIEWVSVLITSTHPNPDTLTITLTSPGGTASIMHETTANFLGVFPANFELGTGRCLGESTTTTQSWTLAVNDGTTDGSGGSTFNYQIQIWGR